ncbi:MAG: polysaccharide deacetylase family protein [Chitinophaga sp.]|uniref:polysaccharide deacetylase family protein n=1 Tax=Chitinophaga sp. TaxID=1869181 RepID=UPI0025BAFE8C|nr:polysaccharide deacetylase family protein [Chitinophaga sp.]MBV8253546.1 polysaccharide deacetylase family protein [Chitinophaga sp.]
MKKMLLLLLLSYAAIIHAQNAIPILCYHNISMENTGKSNGLHISRQQLNAQLKSLADSGYHTILPDELVKYLTSGRHVSPKTFMVTFDDSHEEHFSIADSLLHLYGFRGVFFIMTVTIGKPHYMTAAQLKSLSDRGNVVASHTWDHPYLRPTGVMDWKKQLDGPKQQLEKITGRPVLYFAYPFGEWNDSMVIHLKSSGYKAAFQMSGAGENNLYTIRRMPVDGRWSGPALQQHMARFMKE